MASSELEDNIFFFSLGRLYDYSRKSVSSLALLITLKNTLQAEISLSKRKYSPWSFRFSPHINATAAIFFYCNRKKTKTDERKPFFVEYLQGKYHGDFDLLSSKWCENTFLNIKNMKSTEFLKGATQDLL